MKLKLHLSLHATFLRNRIVTALRADPRASQAVQNVSQNFVFENPTLRDLSVAVSALVLGKALFPTQVNTGITKMVEKYSTGLTRHFHTQPHSSVGAVVLLTGSTGHVGSYILAALLAHPNISKIYTLNRPSKLSYSRQKASFEERGLDCSLLDSSKVVSLVGDLTREDLDLDATMFAEVCAPLSVCIGV